MQTAAGPGRELRLTSVEPQGGIDTAQAAEDMRGETGQTYSRADFSGGEGLARAHRRAGTDRDPTRFWNSRNVDVIQGRAEDPPELKLLHSASSLRSADASNTRVPLVKIGSVLYGVIADDVQVDRTANPTAGAPTWSQEAPGGTGDILDLAVLGDELYAARTTIRKRNGAGTWALWSDLVANRIWSVKGRIIAAVGTSLYDARAGIVGNSILLHTVASGTTWNDVVDAGGAILAAASDGYVYSFVDEDGDLALRGQTFFEGENPVSLGYGQGIVLIGTSEPTTAGGQIGRLWRMLLVGLRLREAEVIRQWGIGTETRNRVPQKIIATREALWTGVIEDGAETHLWRYNIETGGLTRDLILTTTGLVQGIVSIDDRLFANVFNTALWRENTTYATTGYLIGPLADFFNASRKAWAGARLSTSDMPTSTQVVLAYSTDPLAIENPAHSTWTNIITATPSSPGDDSEFPITEVEARYLAGKLTLTPNGANTATPVVLGFSFRALPLPTEENYAIPVNVSDQLEVPHRKALKIPGRGQAVYEALHTIKGKTVTLTLLRTNESVIGQITGLDTPISDIPERGSVAPFALLKVLGARQ